MKYARRIDINRPGGRGAPFTDTSFQTSASIKGSEMDGKTFSEIGTETKVIIRQYAGRNVPIDRITEDIATSLNNKGFEVYISTTHEGYPAFLITANKTSKIKKIIGSGRNAIISIRGIPVNFEVSLATDDWKKNIVVLCQFRYP